MRQLIYTSLLLIITFRFSCGEKKNLIKHQKVSKYYDHECEYRVLIQQIVQNNRVLIEGS